MMNLKEEIKNTSEISNLKIADDIQNLFKSHITNCIQQKQHEILQRIAVNINSVHCAQCTPSRNSLSSVNSRQLKTELNAIARSMEHDLVDFQNLN